MKTRINLVSNSSSSSYVIVAPAEIAKKIYRDLHPWIKFVLPKLEKAKVGDQEVMFLLGHSSTEDMEFALNEYEGTEIVDSDGNPSPRKLTEEDKADWTDYYDIEELVGVYPMTEAEAVGYYADLLSKHTNIIYEDYPC